MSYWLFKVAKQDLYPDVPGEKYVYDNTHSLRVAAGDTFLYLDKRHGYEFSGTGTVKRVSKRNPTTGEAARTKKVKTVLTAHLIDVIAFAEPLSISPSKKVGRENRARLGIADANLLGWSRSMPGLSESMYEAIMDLAEATKLIPTTSPPIESDYFVGDAWGKTRIRKAIHGFSEEVLTRHSSTCVVCGTSLELLVDAAHISPYAIDKMNRANPANGLCLCTFCHRALDRRLIGICPDGTLLVAKSISDPIAKEHFTKISAARRRKWLRGVGPEFLELTVTWFNQCSRNITQKKVPETVGF